MTNWQTKKLGEISTIKRGGSPRPIQDYLVGNDQDGYSWLKIGDVPVGSRYIHKTSAKIKPEGLKKTTLVKKGEFILSNSMSFGRPYIMMTDACIHDGWLALQDITDDTDKQFLYYLLTSVHMQNKFKNFSAGSGVLNLKKETVQAITFNAPEKLEQERIVGVLEVWDEYIEKLEQKIALKEQLKKGLMQQLLTGKRRLPGFSKEWKAHKLGDFLQEPVYKREDNPKEIELLTVRLHAKGVHATGKFPFATEKGRPYYRRFQGEILIGRQNFHNGGVGTVTKKTHGLIASNAISSYVPKLNANLDFMLFALQRGDFYKRIGYIIGGTGQKEISPSEFKKLKIIMPELEEQEAIASVLKKSNEELQTLYVYAKYINQQKQYLLKNLITGTIRTPEDLQPLDASRLERSAL